MCKVLLYSILLVFLNLLLNGFWKSPLSLLLTTTRGCTCLRLVLCLSRWPHTEVVSQLTSVSRFSSVAHNFSFCKPESPDDFFYSFAALWTGLKGRESNISVQRLQCYRSCCQTRFQRFNFYTLVLSHVDTTSQVSPPNCHASHCCDHISTVQVMELDRPRPTLAFCKFIWSNKVAEMPCEVIGIVFICSTVSH